ncbi:hypothetical protein [Novosphingobium sp. PC22D]|uniref:hypothetical protein n=1 Tax=Novosphingobium sp. PC22D TaxID=1962403 RepID=UPI000BF1AE13|nr:hypothetical protein [Novosphingobium sp. PC22D]
MGKRKFEGAAAALALVASLGTAATARAAIVVSSSGPSAAKYPVGTKVEDSERITLQAGDSVTVIEKQGTRELKGPGRFRVDGPTATAKNTTFAIFSQSRQSSRAIVGGTRLGEGARLSPNLWYVDLDRPGNYCLSDPDEITFWRADEKAPARYTLAGAGTAQTLTFAKGASMIATDTPIATGAEYTVYRDGEDAPVGTAKFVVLEDAPQEAEGLADMLIANGCMAQLKAMSNALAVR